MKTIRNTRIELFKKPRWMTIKVINLDNENEYALFPQKWTKKLLEKVDNKLEDIKWILEVWIYGIKAEAYDINWKAKLAEASKTYVHKQVI